MRRVLLIVHAGVAYAGFLVVILWSVTFLAGVDVISDVDSGTAGAAAPAVLVDLSLLSLFAIHHTVLARPGVKRKVTRVLPAAAERSTYVLCADALLALVLWQWRPIGGDLWNVTAEPWRDAVWTLYLAGWLLAVASTFMIDHFDLVGLRQATSRAYRAPEFQARWLYLFVRHPLMLGLLIAFWVTPTMSFGHLLFAASATAYIAIGVRFEEHDLRRELGQPYADYARRTPAIMPRLRRAVATVDR